MANYTMQQTMLRECLLGGLLRKSVPRLRAHLNYDVWQVSHFVPPLVMPTMKRTMSDPFVPRVGGILNADIAVPEHDREVRFYSRVLTTGENPLWREDLMNNLGTPIVGLGARSPEYDHLPLQWMPHIQVADVAASVKRALDLGGNELMHSQGGDGESQWAVLLDPNGSAFGIVPVASAEEIPPTDGSAVRVGRISWINLTVSDASATRDFYRQVVDWSVQDVDMEDASERYADYNMFGDDGKPAAGVCHARGVNLGLPTTWMIYLPVGDLAESVRRVREEGGEIIKATRENDGEYACAVVQDPVGACLGLVRG
ncbi:MAG: putative enzyme related to lactoylglutathione lyase [Planctomycetota bacterium]|jgi:predicted enzyme related to lactoylglutathione lyase